MAVTTASPVRTLLAGTVAQVVLFVGLTLYAGLGTAGWLTGIAYLVIGVAAILTGMRYFGATTFGPADLVTLSRAVLIGGVTVLVADVPGPVPVATMVTIAAIALALDAVDGRVARRTGTVSEFGARFDMEVDAFLILVLSAYLADTVGPWVLAIGVMRYVFVIAGRLVRWLHAPLPHSMIRKTVAATQGVILAVAASGVLGQTVNTVVLALALAVLAGSFGYDVLWLYRNRSEPEPESTTEQDADLPARSTPRRILAGVTTGLAAVFVLFTLLAPNQINHLTPAAFARIPIEALIGVALVLVLPTVLRRVAGIVLGVAFGLLLLVKLTDMGFNETLGRPFDLVLDWTFLGPGLDFLADSIGWTGAILVVIGIGLLILGVPVLMVLGIMRLSRLLSARRTATTRTVAVLGVVWLVCAVLGVQFSHDTPVASRAASDAVYGKARAVRAALLDPEKFASESAVDRFRDTPGDRLLTGLRGKDVLLNFVESYGVVALQDPVIAPGVTARLAAGNAKLKAAGFQSRSGYLSSSTFGGGSWLAHASMQSGLWINNQQRYDALTANGSRLSLTKAFKRAGWDTYGASPQIKFDWPEGKYFGYDKMYTWNNLEYKGPTFAYSKIPDQWLLQHLDDETRKPDDKPVMGEIDLTSSHSPWAPLPSVMPWEDLGDGTVFGPQEANRPHGDAYWPDETKVKQIYGDSIEYVIDTLVAYLEKYGDDDLVMIFLGDHQPAPIVSGEDASHDVPITIVAKDPKVIQQIQHWGWSDGLQPKPDAPVWKMSKFRDRFLSAFGSTSTSNQAVAAPHR